MHGGVLTESGMPLFWLVKWPISRGQVWTLDKRKRRGRNLGSSWPLYRIEERGRPHSVGELRALHPGFRLLPEGDPPAWLAREYPAGVFSGLPFFLQDAAPQGYLGRMVAREASPGRFHGVRSGL